MQNIDLTQRILSLTQPKSSSNSEFRQVHFFRVKQLDTSKSGKGITNAMTLYRLWNSMALKITKCSFIRDLVMRGFFPFSIESEPDKQDLYYENCLWKISTKSSGGSTDFYMLLSHT